MELSYPALEMYYFTTTKFGLTIVNKVWISRVSMYLARIDWYFGAQTASCTANLTLKFNGVVLSWLFKRVGSRRDAYRKFFRGGGGEWVHISE